MSTPEVARESLKTSFDIYQQYLSQEKTLKFEMTQSSLDLLEPVENGQSISKTQLNET